MIKKARRMCLTTCSYSRCRDNNERLRITIAITEDGDGGGTEIGSKRDGTEIYSQYLTSTTISSHLRETLKQIHYRSKSPQGSKDENTFPSNIMNRQIMKQLK